MRRSLTLLCLAGGLFAVLGPASAQAQLALPDAGGQARRASPRRRRDAGKAKAKGRAEDRSGENRLGPGQDRSN